VEALSKKIPVEFCGRDSAASVNAGKVRRKTEAAVDAGFVRCLFRGLDARAVSHLRIIPGLFVPVVYRKKLGMGRLAFLPAVLATSKSSSTPNTFPQVMMKRGRLDVPGNVTARCLVGTNEFGRRSK
jgi:hypothetical protein